MIAIAYETFFVAELNRRPVALLYVPKQLINPQPQRLAEHPKPPVEDPQPYKDPVEPAPGDPQEDRPMHDPVPPDGDRPRS